MEFNRLISLVIGFIVLILVFIWIGSRFRSTTKTETAQKVTVTLTATPTITPTTSKEAGTGWNPLAFLFNRNGTPTPTPSKVVVKKVTNTIVPTGFEPIITTTEAETQVEPEGETVIVYRNNKTGKTVTMNNGTVITQNNGTITTKGGTIKQIPETGAPTLLIPLAFSALTLGAYLRKRV